MMRGNVDYIFRYVSTLPTPVNVVVAHLVVWRHTLPFNNSSREPVDYEYTFGL